jgi:hypothetical protein
MIKTDASSTPKPDALTLELEYGRAAVEKLSEIRREMATRLEEMETLIERIRSITANGGSAHG